MNTAAAIQQARAKLASIDRVQPDAQWTQEDLDTARGLWADEIRRLERELVVPLVRVGAFWVPAR